MAASPGLLRNGSPLGTRLLDGMSSRGSERVDRPQNTNLVANAIDHCATSMRTIWRRFSVTLLIGQIRESKRTIKRNGIWRHRGRLEQVTY